MAGKKGCGGAKTDEGHFRQIIASGLLTSGRYSTILEKVRKCNTCPLGARKIVMKTKGGEVERVLPGACKSWAEGKTECVLAPREFITRCRMFFQVEKELEKQILQRQIVVNKMDEEICRETEILEQGMPGFYTHRFSELNAGNIEKLHKMKYGEKQIIKHEGSVPLKEFLQGLRSANAEKVIDVDFTKESDNTNNTDNTDNTDASTTIKFINNNEDKSIMSLECPNPKCKAKEGFTGAGNRPVGIDEKQIVIYEGIYACNKCGEKFSSKEIQDANKVEEKK